MNLIINKYFTHQVTHGNKNTSGGSEDYYLEKLKKMKNKNFRNCDDEYKYMLKKGMTQYYKIKWISNRNKIKFYFLGAILGITIFQMIKYGLVAYYYVMWEVDIRKPRVSDYIIERFR